MISPPPADFSAAPDGPLAPCPPLGSLPSDSAAELTLAWPPGFDPVEKLAPHDRPAAEPIPAPSPRPPAQPDAPPVRSAGDSLADSVVVLLVMAVLQRLIGLVRSILVCRWLAPEQLGSWDLANRFLVLCAPLVVLGIPGCFGRYLEHYRQRGLLRTVLFRTAVLSAALVAAAAALFLAQPAFLAEQVFGDPAETRIASLAALSLVAVVAYNFLVEMLTALRQVRVGATIQLLNSLSFAVLAVVLLAFWRTDAEAILAAFAGSCLVGALLALAWIGRGGLDLPSKRAPLSHAELWAKLLPFAAWVWLTNLLYNLSDVVGRYLLLHHGGLPDPQAAVGQYHSATLLPVLMLSVASILSGMLLPHLTRDWERHRRTEVYASVNLTLKWLGLSLFAASVVILAAGPLLFRTAFLDKYAQGLEILPLVLLACNWSALATVAQAYLWCAERARLGCLALGGGLLINAAITWLSLPAAGLSGVALGAACGSLATVAVMLWLDRRLGLQLESGTLLVVLLPATLAGGLWTAALGLLAVAVASLASDRILLPADRDKLARLGRRFLRR